MESNEDYARIIIDSLMKQSLKLNKNRIYINPSNDAGFKKQCHNIAQDIQHLTNQLLNVISDDEHSEIKKLQYTYHTIKLISIIYSEEPKKHDIMEWLKERLYYYVESYNKGNSNLVQNHYYEVISAFVCTYHLDEAIKLAMEKQKYTLAQIIFNYKKQPHLRPFKPNLNMLKIDNVNIGQNSALMSICELLSGKPQWHLNKGNLALLHQFSIFIWFICGENNLDKAIFDFNLHCHSRGISLFPAYSDFNKQNEYEITHEITYDIHYYLLYLYSKICSPHETISDIEKYIIFDINQFKDGLTDVHMTWILYDLLLNYNKISIKERETMFKTLIDKMVNYCEACKYPHWAIYVYQRCQLISQQELNDCINIILKRNIDDWIHNEEYYQIMTNDLNISNKLLIKHKIEYWNIHGDYEMVLKLCYEIEDYECCHDTLILKLGPLLCQNEKTFKTQFLMHVDKMKEFKDKIKNWPYGGAILSGETKNFNIINIMEKWKSYDLTRDQFKSIKGLFVLTKSIFEDIE